MLHGPILTKLPWLIGVAVIAATETVIVSASAQWALTAGIGITAIVSIATGYFQVLARQDANRRADKAEELRLAKEKKDEENRKADRAAREEVAAKAEEAARLVAKVAVNVEASKDEQNNKLDGLAKDSKHAAESLKEIHVAVNSTLTAAVSEAADAKALAYQALKRIFELTGTEEDKLAMESAKDSATKAAELVKAKADALKIGEDLNQAVVNAAQHAEQERQTRGNKP
jgi:low affinity Fe/Cu permease